MVSSEMQHFYTHLCQHMFAKDNPRHIGFSTKISLVDMMCIYQATDCMFDKVSHKKHNCLKGKRLLYLDNY